MKAVGIVAEYNPFHFGHRYQLQTIREQCGAETPIVAVMSGDYVQRGEPAAFDKFTRAEAAVGCGVSLVLELPLPWSLSSAEGFARGGIGLLGATGVVDAISFGSESGDLSSVEKTAAALETAEFSAILKEELSGGTPFAAARAAAARRLLGDAAAVLDTPNDLLAVEYMRAAGRLGYTFNYIPVQRIGSVHDGAGSASELRAVLHRGGTMEGQIPDEAFEVFRRETEIGRGYISPEKLCTAFLSRLREKTPENFAAVPDAGEGLYFRLYEASRRGTSPEEIADLAKSRRYAHARLRRMVMCAALGIRAGDAAGIPPYLRVLSFDERGAALLREMKTSAVLPVITKSSRIKDECEEAQRIFRLGSGAHDLFVLGRDNCEFWTADDDYRATPRHIVPIYKNNVGKFF